MICFETKLPFRIMRKRIVTFSIRKTRSGEMQRPIRDISHCAVCKIAKVFPALVLLCAMTNLIALGQVAAPAKTSSLMPVPISHLYWHFLILQNHLDREAAANEQRG